MQKEAQEYMKKCDWCQRFASSIHWPGGVLNPLSSLWPFAQWGLDTVGLFPKAAGKNDICWSARATSPSGLKLNFWQISGMWIPRNLFGKILSHDSGSVIPSYQTMAFNSTANLLGDTIVILELQIGIPL